MYKIINDNCFNAMSKLKCVDHIITSPPYNRKRNDKYNCYSDTVVDYYEFLVSFVEEALKITNRYVFLNIQKNYYNKIDVYKLIGYFSKEIVEIITWTKSNPMPASGSSITNSYEFILVLSKKEKSLKSNTTYTKNHIHTSVYSENPYKKTHRAVMKPEVAKWIIDKFTNYGETILDPFAGVGTTMEQGVNLNRSVIGIEISKEYCDIIEERMKQTQ